MVCVGALQPVPRSRVTATPHSVVYQRTCMSGRGPSKFKIQHNFSEGRTEGPQNHKALWGPPPSWGKSLLLIWLVGICPTSTPSLSNNPSSGCSVALQGILQSLTGYLYSTYPHRMDEWVWWLLLPQGPTSKQPAKAEHLLEDDVMSHLQKEL